MTRLWRTLGALFVVALVGGVAVALLDDVELVDVARQVKDAADTSPTLELVPLAPDEATVTDIVDGDTLTVAMPDGTTERVRIVGVDTPELAGYGAECKEDEPGGCAAKTALEALAPVGSVVTLTVDVTDRDRYGRLLRHVGTPTTPDVAEPLICGGHAEPADYPPDTSRSARYHQLARGEGCVG